MNSERFVAGWGIVAEQLSVNGGGQVIFNVLLVTVTVTGTVGINEVAAHDMKIYPNPAKDKLFIEMENPLKSLITISDQIGRVLQTETIQGKNNTIDISGIAAGIYHLKVQRENSEYIYKVIVQ